MFTSHFKLATVDQALRMGAPWVVEEDLQDTFTEYKLMLQDKDSWE